MDVRIEAEFCLCVPTRVDGRRSRRFFFSPAGWEREKLTSIRPSTQEEEGIRIRERERETKLEKSQEIPDFVRALAGNDANPATVPLYRSWQCVCVCLLLLLFVCVCPQCLYMWLGVFDIVCVCVCVCVCVLGFLSSHYFPPTRWMDGWMDDRYVIVYTSEPEAIS